MHDRKRGPNIVSRSVGALNLLKMVLISMTLISLLASVRKKHQDELKSAYTILYLIFPCSRPRPKTRKAASPRAFIRKHGQGRDESLGMEEIIVKAPKWSAEFSRAVGELLTGDSHILCSEGAGDPTLCSPAQQATKTALSFRLFITGWSGECNLSWVLQRQK